MDERADPGDGWPRCPHCDAPRITRCPICQTTGSDFPEADTEYVWGLGLEEVPETDADACACGACGATSSCARQDALGGETPGLGADGEDDGGRRSRAVLMCQTCDEPFVPQYPRRCAWCGYTFPDGYEVDVVDQPPEQLAGRVILVLIGLGLLLALVAGYFVVIL